MFNVKKQSDVSHARLSEVQTNHGILKGTGFLPDATRGFVRSLSGEDLQKSGVEAMVVNTFHLHLRPGMDVVRSFGGIHDFMGWQGPLMSDSGGYQVFSLSKRKDKFQIINSKLQISPEADQHFAENSKFKSQKFSTIGHSQNHALVRVTDEGVEFRSPIDGAKHFLTPEKSIQIQFDLGVDMMVCLDDVPPLELDNGEMEQSVGRTVAWAKICKSEYEKLIEKSASFANFFAPRASGLDALPIDGKVWDGGDGYLRPLLIAVIQGGVDKELRRQCASELVSIGFDGYGFGGRPVDKEGNFLDDILSYTALLIPESALRFGLGIGAPEDILRCVLMGWDLFDCVIPTREARHGRVYKLKLKTQSSKLKALEINKDFYDVINITNAKCKEDPSPLDENCECELCQNYSLGYLHHLFKSNESLGWRLATQHNLMFYMKFMKMIREGIESGSL